MSTLTAADVMRLAEENEVQLVRLQFTDILGATKNITIAMNQLETALENGIMFDGSSIEGFVRIQESDMYLKPDPSTFCVFPWDSHGKKVARIICDVYTADNQPFAGCPRGVLKRMTERAAKLGYTMYVGPEPEFFLLKTDDAGVPLVETNDRGGYFDLSPIDKGEAAR